MKLNNTVLTLALLGALVIAALAGGLLPAGSPVHAADPGFDDASDPITRDVPENTPPGVNIGAPISATDADEGTLEYGNTLTYSLDGDDAGSFDIDSSTGQLITKAALDREAEARYSVTVTVDDGETRTTDCTDCTRDVTITVTDVNEPPAAPIPPTVVSGEDDDQTSDNDESTTSLKVVWHPPQNTGRPNLEDYNVEYKRSISNAFLDSAVLPTGVTLTVTGTTATITGLEVDASYDVRVRATNNDGNGPWSFVGTGSTNKEGNSAPSFLQADPHEENVPENSPAGQNVGVAVTADDANARTLRYEFKGRDAGLFDFNSSSGQIRTKRGVTYNHEDPACGYVDTASPTACTYFVTVVAFDGAGGSDAISVGIQVNDRTEHPSAPAQPTVRPTANLRTSLDVSWSEPANTGPAITAYTVEYRRKGSTIDFSTSGVPDTITDTSTTISGTDSANNNIPWLAAGISYEVRVRATSREGTSDWSPLGTGSTNGGNREPVFRDRNIDATPVGVDATTERELNENTQPGRPVGRPVVADDGDGDKRTYRLEASADTPAARTQAALFDINESTGQILTEGPLNHEDAGCGYIANDATTVCAYTVNMEVGDGLDENRVKEESFTADDTIIVMITVNDMREPPSAPMVTITSSEDVTTLGVTWEAANTGPPITKYHLRYRQGSTYSDDNCVASGNGNCTGLDNDNDDDNENTLTATIITGLTANTSYGVEMRALNEEGTGPWSSPKSQRTNRNKSANTPNSVPDFINVDTMLEVNESDQSGLDVGTVTTSDSDGGTLRYTLDGSNKDLFSIGSSSAQITTRRALNTEAICRAVDAGASGGHQANCTYTVRVKVVDGQGGSASALVTITVADQLEPPDKPSAPRVTATTGSGKSLEVTWNEPRNTGPTIDDYDIRYREVGGSDDAWVSTNDAADSTERSARITGLDPRTTYEAEVRAGNNEGDGQWSSVGRGTTNASNNRPDFDDTASAVTLSVDENTRVGQPVGSPVSASDDDQNRLTYSLEGPGKDSFTIVSSSGQIRTRAPLDYEERSSYSVTVKVDDGQRKDNSVAAKSVTISIGDVDEIPSVPAAPKVSGVPGSTDSVRVTWEEPANTGPSISDYDLQYGVARTGGFTSWHHDGVDRSATITGLIAGTRYEVRVQARNADGASGYSRSGTGAPNPDVANRNPVFSGGARTFSVAENTAAGDPIGDPVDATDPDDDPLAYELEGTDAVSFDIDRGSGQIRTSAALNHEEKSRYSVTVRARDGRGGTSTAGVTISVTDLIEPPSAPLSPTVIGASSTSLQVSWEEPENTGPPITDYDYRYRDASTLAWTEVTNTTIAETTVTIPSLTASTSYDVEVRAKNAEGGSDWSDPGIGSTNAPGANNPPVFSEGASATRSLSASSPTGTRIGEPVAATDADSGDTVEYSLEGRDAASFAINETNGQLLTKSGVTLIAGETYTVVVVADDTKDTASITVTIEATAAPPNNPPVFSEGASTTRTVASSAPAGTAVGQPVRATDADAGTTLNYTLEGTDAASFAINSASGQLLTRSGVTLDRSSYTVEVVASDGTASERITVTINVILNAAPQFSEGASATRTVASSEPAGTAIGDPVTATDADAGDTVTYSLAGTDAASFTVNSASGQLLTRSGVTLDRSSYTVVVVASDGTASARITVTINVVLNTAPEFANTSTSRSVEEQGSIGDNVGGPVTATDADQGDTLTYTLGGADAASFSIVAASGQIRTAVVLDEETRASYTVTVTANDGTTDSDPITVNIAVTDVTYGCATGGAIADADATNTGLVRDCEALLEARNKLENGARILNWSHVNPITSWQGVYFGGTTSRVTKVIVRRGGLAGTVAAELGDLDMLTELNLHSNRLSGEIPSDLDNLYRLEKLLLHNNQLTGTIPDLSGLRSLKMLWLSGRDMDLTGGVPSWLNSMSSLESVSLWGNSLGGQIPVLTGMTSVNLLKLQSNGLTDSVPAWFADMSSLRILYLHDNNLTGTIPAAFGLHTGLIRFWLDRNNLTGSIPAALGNMTNLRTLNLRDNQLSGSIPPELGNLSNLQHLRLHNNQLSGSIPAALGDMSSLRQLWVSNNQLSGSIPAVLGNLSSLQQLNLHTNNLSGVIPSQLGNLSNLTRLRIGGVDGNRGNIGLFGCVPAALRNATDADDLALAGANGISICP